MTHSNETDKARAIIRDAVKARLQDICKDLESLDNVFLALGLKGTSTDLNIRTAAIALNAARATA